MRLWCIEFVPFDVPLKHRLETLAAGCCFITLIFGPLVSTVATIYLLLYSNYKIYLCLYLAWVYLWDLNVSNTGGRRRNWVRGLSFWAYVKNYFPLEFVKLEETKLDSTKNYIFCSFPHGMFPMSLFSALATDRSDFHKLFPCFTPYGATLNLNFLIPFYREFALSMGLVSANAKSIRWILNRPKGGHVVALTVGGASEAMQSKPGHYHFVLKNRKGFVKLALETGSPLVPVLSFGEPDLFDQVSNPEGSLLRRFQELCKKYLGYAPIIVMGRGFFQDTFGLIPKRKPVTTVVGVPLNVEKIGNPTPEDVSNLHQRFMDHLVDFFQQYKHKYLPNADEIDLIIT